jgi:transposase-like protein
VLDELVPSALHTGERHANNPVEADHGRLKARLRPMRGLKIAATTRTASADDLASCTRTPQAPFIAAMAVVATVRTVTATVSEHPRDVAGREQRGHA